MVANTHSGLEPDVGSGSGCFLIGWVTLDDLTSFSQFLVGEMGMRMLSLQGCLKDVDMQ